MKTEAAPRVGVVDALATGLVEAARRPWLMIIPLITELLLWVMPQLSVERLINRTMQGWESAARSIFTPVEMAAVIEMMKPFKDAVAQYGPRLNLLDGLAGGWLGFPSGLVMFPVDLPRIVAPPGRGGPIDIPGPGWYLLCAALFWVVGQVLAAAYLRWAATSWRQHPPALPATSVDAARGRTAGSVGRPRTGAAAQPAARPGPAAGSRSSTPVPAAAAPMAEAGLATAASAVARPLVAGPWAGMRGLFVLVVRLALYSLLVGAVVLVLQLPVALAVGLLSLSGNPPLSFLLLALGLAALTLTLWFLVSVFFATEAIVLDQQTIPQAIMRSLVLVRDHFWATLGLAVVINLLMYGFRAVWGMVGYSVPGAAFALVANAYLATGMLLAIFAFYESRSRRLGLRRVVGSRV
jgi:hypothetical protein